MTVDQYRAAASLPPRQNAASAPTAKPVPGIVRTLPGNPPPSSLSKPDEKPMHAAAAIEVQPTAPEPQQPTALLPTYRIVGEVFNCYILVEQEDTLLLIDKHAAHERILFEEFKAKLKQVEGAAQLLLTPIVLNMSGEECGALTEYRDELEEIGFAFLLKGTRVEITQIPNGVSVVVAPDLLGLLAAQILTDRGDVRLTRDLLFERALYQASCKSAIKGGRVYDEGHIAWLVERLLSLPDITVCPHGRPVAIKLTHQALDRQFSRE